MTCNNSNSNINKTFILEPLSITGGSTTLTASTALYTNQVKSYSGNTTITMGTNIISFNHDISIEGNVTAEIYYGDGSQLSGVAKHDYYTTAVTLDDTILYFNRNDQLSAYTLDLRNLLFTGGSGLIYARHVLKNTDVINNSLPSNLFAGEPFVNTAEGIMYFSGVTSSAISGWTKSDSGSTFWEVGSNLYDLNIRHRITKYENQTGNGLVGKFLSGSTDGFVLANISDIKGIDTYVTAFTYNNNILTISQNDKPNLTAYINSFTGLTVNGDLTITGLDSNRVIYTKSSGILASESTFEYDDNLNKLSVNNIDVVNDLVVYGNLTIWGQSVSAFTSQLYVEDKNITLNWNPTGSTSSTSIQAGWTIQDGDGLTGDINLEIVRMKNLTGLTVNEIPDVTEYAGQSTGYANRGWITQLNDIVIRSTDITDTGTAGSINGVRVLAEFDILDGGTY